MLLVCVVTWAVRTHFFFWDTIQLASQHAHFFEKTYFTSFLLPDEMDSGHPPTVGLYLAFMWKLFGKSLTISHLCMLPFLIGIIWQAWLLAYRTVGEGWAILFLLLLCASPMVASQAILVSPDVMLLFFFLMTLNGILAHNTTAKLGLTLAVLGLSMVSLRGIMVAFACFIIQMYYFFYVNKKNDPLSIKRFFTLILPFSMGGLFTVGFLIFHYMNKGWIGYHASSAWAEAFQVVDFQGFMKNIAVLIWRLLDFGHLFIALITAFGFIYVKKTLPTTRLLLVILTIMIFILTPTLVIYKGLLAHRYLLPIYVISLLLCVKIISDIKNRHLQICLSTIAFIGLITGNFWVYPPPIATGWDATLAHVPYYDLRTEMMQYIDNRGITYSEIGSCFPNQRSFELTDLNNRQANFPQHLTLSNSVENAQFALFDLNKNKYIFYSSIFNDLTATDLHRLKTEWKVVKAFHKGQIEVILYEKQ